MEANTDATAEAAFGRRDAPPVVFLTIAEANTAAEIAGYYEQEMAAPAVVLIVTGVPWTEAYKLELGDVVGITPPWRASEVTARVVEMDRDASTRMHRLRLVEVT